MARLQNQVHIFEVGPRDGLQNESKKVTLKQKIQWVEGLVRAGVRDFEMGAFVRSDRVPQMAHTEALCEWVHHEKADLRSARDWYLVPNRIGLENALNAGATRIAVFGAATESFVKRNIGMTLRESFLEFQGVIREGRSALKSRFRVRGYISTAFGCPFEGKVSVPKAMRSIEKMAALGVDQISIGDTIGVATPLDVEKLLTPALKLLGSDRTAVHFHDTRGTALANALRAYQIGVRVFDSSAGGLGGCPFAPGASGNLATEDLIYMFDGMNVRTGIQLKTLCETSLQLARKMKRPLTSRYLQTYATSCAQKV